MGARHYPNLPFQVRKVHEDVARTWDVAVDAVEAHRRSFDPAAALDHPVVTDAALHLYSGQGFGINLVRVRVRRPGCFEQN